MVCLIQRCSVAVTLRERSWGGGGGGCNGPSTVPSTARRASWRKTYSCMKRIQHALAAFCASQRSPNALVTKAKRSIRNMNSRIQSRGNDARRRAAWDLTA